MNVLYTIVIPYEYNRKTLISPFPISIRWQIYIMYPMMHFDQLHILDKHSSLLKKIMWEDVFLVGWAVRDIILGISNDPTDIDATCAIAPDLIRQSLQKNASNVVWLFRTEKFWTATYIAAQNIMLQEDTPTNPPKQISYEITPFREEWWYTDHRRPDEIRRTTSLMLDASRRDFTINSLYYFSYWLKSLEDVDRQSISMLHVSEDQLMIQLAKQWWSYIPWAQLLVIQDHELIEQIFPRWMYNHEVMMKYFSERNQSHIWHNGVRFLIDPKLWLQDIVAQKLRTVWEPDRRFNEDALRILRALRFVNIWNQLLPWATFDFHKDTRNSIKKKYYLIQYLAKERIHEELLKVFKARNPFGYVALLDEANLLQYIFPALYRCKHNDQPIRYHPFDTYTHILLTLWHLQGMNDNYLVKLWMLYHDVGKPDQYYYYAQCKTREEIEALHGSWANHTICGAEFAERDFLALWFSAKEVEEISWYVAMHMRPWQILDARDDNQIKKLRLLYSEFWYDYVKNLFDICKADRLWQYNPLQWAEIASVDVLYKKLNILRDTEWQFTKKELAITGYDIMESLHIPAGPLVGELLHKSFQWVVHDVEHKNKKDIILAYIKGLIPYDE